MSLYERLAEKPGGGRALAVARLRRSVLAVLHRALNMSGLESQAELAKLLRFRRSAINQVFRGDGNVRISTLAEYLYEMGYEVDLTLVEAGELRAAALENRKPVPAIASWSATTSVTYAPYHLGIAAPLDLHWNTIQVDVIVNQVDVLVNDTLLLLHLAVSSGRPGLISSADSTYESINMSERLAISGASS